MVAYEVAVNLKVQTELQLHVGGWGCLEAEVNQQQIGGSALPDTGRGEGPGLLYFIEDAMQAAGLQQQNQQWTDDGS